MRVGGNVTGGSRLNHKDYSWNSFAKGFLKILGMGGGAAGAQPMIPTCLGNTVTSRVGETNNQKLLE